MNNINRWLARRSLPGIGHCVQILVAVVALAVVITGFLWLVGMMPCP